ncbi:MAG TPA: collagen-binding domain-containing protein, partial [Candidatus Kapabacteria bacterium]|nr:collagen-binding domain-containing protein [Candidatus Kapabacteria bacterium]
NTGGSYDPVKRRDKATVATNSGLKDSVNTGGAKIYGKVMTGAGGTVHSGNGSIIGDLPWHAAHSSGGIDPNAISDDFNLELGTVIAPFTSGFAPEQNVTTNGVTYDYVLETGDYKIASPLIFKGNVLVRGKARLYISYDSSLNFGGTDLLEIAPGATLEVYNASPTASIGGQGLANNSVARNFTYFGLPTNTKFTVSGNGTFVGSIYAPSAAVTLSGGGSTVKDFSGAIVAKSVVFNGTYNFHFDEDLSRDRYRNFVATSWEEIGTNWDGILAGNLNLNTLQ